MFDPVSGFVPEDRWILPGFASRFMHEMLLPSQYPRAISTLFSASGELDDVTRELSGTATSTTTLSAPALTNEEKSAWLALGVMIFLFLSHCWGVHWIYRVGLGQLDLDTAFLEDASYAQAKSKKAALKRDKQTIAARWKKGWRGKEVSALPMSSRRPSQAEGAAPGIGFDGVNPELLDGLKVSGYSAGCRPNVITTSLLTHQQKHQHKTSMLVLGVGGEGGGDKDYITVRGQQSSAKHRRLQMGSIAGAAKGAGKGGKGENDGGKGR